MRRRAFLGALAGTTMLPPATATAEGRPLASTQRWFIQAWLEGNFPVELDPSDDPGRLEITIAGEFVACSLAAVYRSEKGDMFLVPLSIGAATTGRREDIKVEVYGALKRLPQPTVKITEIGA